MKRAEALILPPRFLQRDVGGDQIDQVDALADLVSCGRRDSSHGSFAGIHFSTACVLRTEKAAFPAPFRPSMKRLCSSDATTRTSRFISVLSIPRRDREALRRGRWIECDRGLSTPHLTRADVR